MSATVPVGERLRSVGGRTAAAVRRAPVTAVVVLLVAATSVLGIVLRVASHGGIGVERLGPFRAFAVSTGFLALLVTVAGAVLLVGVSERLMGPWRTIVAFVVTTVVGTGLGAMTAFVDADGADVGRLFLLRASAFDPWTAIVGTVATASAFAGALWRRRVRVNAIAVVAALLLYAGHTADLYAGLAAGAGWGLGELLRRAPKRTGWVRSSHRETRVLLGTAVVVSAVGPVIALVSHARVGLLAPLTAVIAGAPKGTGGCRIGGVTQACVRGVLDAHHADPRALVLVLAPLIALAVGGVGLFRGSRFAMWLVVVIDVLTAVAAATAYGLFPHRVERAHGVVADDQVLLALSIIASVLVPLGTAVVLVAFRSAFPVRPARRRVVAFAVTVAVAVLVVGTVVLVVADASPDRVPDLPGLLLSVLGPVDPTVAGGVPLLDPVLRGVVLVGGPAVWIVVAVAAIRPTGAGQRDADDDADATTDDRHRARALLVAAGGDTFGWMTTWRGNDYWFSPDGRSGVAYRRSGAVAVTVGGPFGYPDARGEALTAFARYCDDHGWTAVFYGVEAGTADVLVPLGWGTLPVAEDADLDPREWTMTGKRKQDVRTSVNRARREGITATWAAWSELPIGTVRQIEAISEEWVAERELPEMGFTLGGIDEMRDPAVRTLVAQDANGRVLAVTSWLPSYRAGRVVGWTLDVMRRSPDAPNGVMEFLVASAAEQMRADGAERLSLSAAPLARTNGASPSQGQIADLLDLVGGVLEPVYGFRSLLRFKQKFGPELHPLVLAYPDPVALPAIGVAVVRAYLPDLSLRQAVGLMRADRA